MWLSNKLMCADIRRILKKIGHCNQGFICSIKCLPKLISVPNQIYVYNLSQWVHIYYIHITILHLLRIYHQYVYFYQYLVIFSGLIHSPSAECNRVLVYMEYSLGGVSAH